MRTNYYVELSLCKKCGRYDRLHLGKHMHGHKFMLRVHNQKGGYQLLNWHDWHTWLVPPFHLKHAAPKIIDEYGQRISIVEIVTMIEGGNLSEAEISALKEPLSTDQWQQMGSVDSCTTYTYVYLPHMPHDSWL